jgi:hypothetical protein
VLEICDGTTGNDDAAPQEKRRACGQARAPRGSMVVFPLGHSAVDSRVEDERVETHQQEQHKLYPEGRVEVAFGGLCPEEEEAATQHDDEAQPCKRKHGSGEARHWNLAEALSDSRIAVPICES